MKTLAQLYQPLRLDGLVFSDLNIARSEVGVQADEKVLHAVLELNGISGACGDDVFVKRVVSLLARWYLVDLARGGEKINWFEELFADEINDWFLVMKGEADRRKSAPAAQVPCEMSNLQ